MARKSKSVCRDIVFSRRCTPIIKFRDPLSMERFLDQVMWQKCGCRGFTHLLRACGSCDYGCHLTTFPGCFLGGSGEKSGIPMFMFACCPCLSISSVYDNFPNNHRAVFLVPCTRCVPRSLYALGFASPLVHTNSCSTLVCGITSLG